MVWLNNEQREELRGEPARSHLGPTNGLRLFELESTCFNEPLQLAGQEAVAFSHVSVACSEGRFGGQSRQFIELGCRFQIFGDAAHVVIPQHQATQILKEKPGGSAGQIAVWLTGASNLK